jgi:hypothetical protein
MTGAPIMTTDDAWQAGYRQGRLDAQAEAPDDDLTAPQELRVWATEQVIALGIDTAVLRNADDLVKYVLNGTLPA